MENSQLSFWQFSDQLRLQNTNLANLSLNDSIWSVSHNNSSWKRPEDRRNFDIRVGGNLNNNIAANPTEKTTVKTNSTPYTSTAAFNDGIVKQENPRPAPADPDFTNDAFSWKIGSGKAVALSQLNGGFNKGIYYNPTGNQFYSSSSTTAGVDHDDVLVSGFVNKNFNLNWKAQNYGKNIHLKNEFSEHRQIQGAKKKKEKDRQSNKLEDQKGDKRFKTLPPSETLPRNEKIGGYIFVCNNDTMEENLRRQLFGLPPRYRDSVRAITPGLPLFLYNYSTHQLHGIYEAASFGASNIDPSAWEDKKNPGESRFPAQVRVQTRKICDPLDEDAFRPILHHYDGPKFRLQLTVPEALSLLDILAEERGC